MRKLKTRIVDGVEVEESSGNVFADLGLPNAEQLNVKAGLVIQIIRAIRQLGLQVFDMRLIAGADTSPFEDDGAERRSAIVGYLRHDLGYATSLRSLTQGRATYAMEFSQYAEAPANVNVIKDRAA